MTLPLSRFKGWLLGWCLLVPVALRAHVGTPYVVLEGQAGSFPVRVVVRQPDVVPGLAEITVRVLSGSPERVAILPLHWNTDRKGAPRADEARPVPGEPGLFSGELWLMARGAYGVEVAVSGGGGKPGGTLVVPVNSVATTQKPLPRWLGGVLGGLGLLLAAGVIGVAAAAWRESMAPPGRHVSGRWLPAVAGAGIGLLLVTLGVVGGARWWRAEERRHQQRVLFHPSSLTARAEAGPGGAGRLEVRIHDPRWAQPPYELLPDHGKLMHLFLVGEGPRPALVHLHPVRRPDGHFESGLPSMPAGTYRVYADVTHEMGLVQTLTNRVEIPAGWTGAGEASDEADSWLLEPASPSGGVMELGDGHRLTLEVSGARSGAEAALRCVVTDRDGRPARLEPYLRMPGHAVITRADGRVFSHVHPAGNLSMAAARKFAEKSGEDQARAMDVVCGDLEALRPEAAAAVLGRGVVQFPFVFPEPGEYQVWIQVRLGGWVRTAFFPVAVAGNPGQR